MSHFEIPPIMTDEEIELNYILSPSHPMGYLDRPMSRNLKKMRDQLAPHQLAAKRMFEAINNYGKYTGELPIAFAEALADVQKIYEQKEK